MRFDVLIKHRNFDSVAQMLHKKSHPRGMFPPEWLLLWQMYYMEIVMFL